MAALGHLEALFEFKGLEALLPQNLPDKLLDEVCNLLVEFQHNALTLDNPLKAYRDMQEIINPASERPCTDATVFLLLCFCRVKSNDELIESLKIIANDNQFGNMHIFLTLQSHFLLEQVKRKGGVDFKPSPTVNNILNGYKRSSKFKTKKSYRQECEDLHYKCFKDDFRKKLGINGKGNS